MATAAIDKGMSIEQVQRLLGHEKIDISKAGNYENYYKVELLSGKTVYFICQKVKVYEVEKKTESSSDDKKSEEKLF